MIAVGTAALLLPFARSGPGAAPFLVALFTATSALSTTGFALTDTPHYWTPFGQRGHRAADPDRRLRHDDRRHVAGACWWRGGSDCATAWSCRRRPRRVGLGDTRRLLYHIARLALRCEAAIAVIVAGRLFLAYDYPAGRALWYGVFHAVQAFNNARLRALPDSLSGSSADWWICLPLTLRRDRRQPRLPGAVRARPRLARPGAGPIHTRLTVCGSLPARVGFVAMLRSRVVQPGHPRAARARRARCWPRSSRARCPAPAGFTSVDYRRDDHPRRSRSSRA